MAQDNASLVEQFKNDCGSIEGGEYEEIRGGSSLRITCPPFDNLTLSSGETGRINSAEDWVLEDEDEHRAIVDYTGETPDVSIEEAIEGWAENNLDERENLESVEYDGESASVEVQEEPPERGTEEALRYYLDEASGEFSIVAEGVRPNEKKVEYSGGGVYTALDKAGYLPSQNMGDEAYMVVPHGTLKERYTHGEY